MRVGDHVAGEVGTTDIAHLALPHQIGERGQRLVDRRQGVGIVQLEQVDIVGVECAQAGLERAHQMRP